MDKIEFRIDKIESRINNIENVLKRNKLN
jgi:hypothetical protein